MSDLKSYDEMDASHRLAYKMGRESVLANPHYQAAFELCEPGIRIEDIHIIVDTALGITEDD